MRHFGVLTNRKRAVIALIHSIVFLGVAASGFVSPKLGILHGNGVTGDFVLIGIYLIVSSILLWLITISRGVVGECISPFVPSALSQDYCGRSLEITPFRLPNTYAYSC
jgi:hypothetical protein